jgi:hypothetical protein
MSGANREDVYRLITHLEGDLRGVNAKFTELRSMLAQGAMTRVEVDEYVCPRCGAPRGGPIALRDHLANVHGILPEEEEAA